MSYEDDHVEFDFNDPDFESKLEAFAEKVECEKLAKDDEKWHLWRQGKLPVSGPL